MPRLVVILLVCLFALCGAGNHVAAKVSAGQNDASGVFENPPRDSAWQIDPQNAGSHLHTFANGDPVNQFDPDGPLAKSGAKWIGDRMAEQAEAEFDQLLNDPDFQRGALLGVAAPLIGNYFKLNKILSSGTRSSFGKVASRQSIHSNEFHHGLFK